MIPTGEIEQTKAVSGTSVRLTINQDLQWKAESLLADKVKQTGALSGTAVAIDVATGKLLAVATAPTFDPSNFGTANATSLVDQAFAGVYEPGSTSKVMTVSAALEEGVVTPTTAITVPPTLHRADRTFHDAEAHGTEKLTVGGVLARSSNIGAIEIGERIEPADDVRLPHQVRRRAADRRQLPRRERGDPRLAPGLERLAALHGAVRPGPLRQRRPGGRHLRDHRERRRPDAGLAGRRLRQPVRGLHPGRSGEGCAGGRRARSPPRCAACWRGSSATRAPRPQAKIPGYRVAGKTGTAQRFDPTCSCYRGFTASFIGMAPADDPKVIVAVTLQRPVKGYYGGSVAAPVFQQIMSYALADLDIPPTGGASPKVKVFAK